MALKCGIVGLPNVGKSTLFNCLSKVKAQSANFPFCTIEPNIGVITVPDERLEKLAELVDPKKVQATTIEIVDIAGIVKGSSKGEGLGNKFLSNIRETNAIIHVLRCFEDDNIVHVDGSVNPVRDKETIDFELQIKDLETIEKKREKYMKIAKSGNKDATTGQHHASHERCRNQPGHRLAWSSVRWHTRLHHASWWGGPLAGRSVCGLSRQELCEWSRGDGCR